jgi:hypothetical protein
VHAPALCRQAQPHLRNRLLILDTNTHWDQWGHVLYFALLRSYISRFNKYSLLCNTSEYSNKVLSKRQRVSTGLFDCQKDTDPPSNGLPAIAGRGRRCWAGVVAVWGTSVGETRGCKPTPRSYGYLLPIHSFVDKLKCPFIN